MNSFLPASRLSPTAIRDLLVRTSRTFALAIPLLPQPTQTTLAVAYLFFRIADTVEDAGHWSRDERVAALGELVRIVRDGSASKAKAAVREWLADGVTDDDGGRDLLGAFPALLDDLAQDPARDRIVREHAARTADGMARTLRAADDAGHVRLASLPALRAYCYVVAGIVGELVTALFVQDVPKLAAMKPTLERHQRAFGEALQLVNILKDEQTDAKDGRVYLPAEVPRHEVISLARADLVEARAYVRALGEGGAPPGFAAFTLLPVELAERTLAAVEERGAGAKVPREEVLALLKRIRESSGELGP
jgi:farnesyl-diphosphate farnesyltransferase